MLMIFACYNMASVLMYSMGHAHYTGWSRLQICYCIPFLYTPYYQYAADLIIINSFGCFISVHMFYCLSRYEILHILASRSLSSFRFYQTCKYKKIMHFIADFIIHGTPCLVALRLPRDPHPYKNYMWILPAMTHVSYPYLLTGSFNPAPLYNITGYSNYKLGWALTLLGYAGTCFINP
jgi:hypothetical protein